MKLILHLGLSYACNMKCKHCFNGDAFVPTDMLDVNTALELVRKACKEYKKVKQLLTDAASIRDVLLFPTMKPLN